MNTSINWARLEVAGRCKAVGVPWNYEEEKAIRDGIPYEYVRLGILDGGALAKRREEEEKDFTKTGVKPLIKIEKEDLLAMAHKLNINATSDAPKAILIQLIEQENKDADIKKASKEVEKDKADGVKRAEKEIEATAKEEKKAKESAEKEEPKSEEDEKVEAKPKKGKKDGK